MKGMFCLSLPVEFMFKIIIKTHYSLKLSFSMTNMNKGKISPT